MGSQKDCGGDPSAGNEDDELMAGDHERDELIRLLEKAKKQSHITYAPLCLGCLPASSEEHNEDCWVMEFEEFKREAAV